MHTRTQQHIVVVNIINHSFILLLTSSELELHYLASSIPSGFPWRSSVQQCSNQYHFAPALHMLMLVFLSFLCRALVLRVVVNLSPHPFFSKCPINRSLLIISVSVILGRLPYSSLLVLCSFQETPRTALSILVYVPSSLFIIFPVIVQHSAP